MNRTQVSTLREQQLGKSMEWGGSGLLEAAFEGRLERTGGSVAARERTPAGELARAPTAEAVTRGAIPLHVPGGAGQGVVRLVEASSSGESAETAARSRLMRALGFLAAILGLLLLVDLLRA